MEDQKLLNQKTKKRGKAAQLLGGKK